MEATTGLVLVLWDVDHTLIDNGGVSKENYALAFQLLTGERPVKPARTGGRTDVSIMAALLVDNGVAEGTFSVSVQLDALTRAGMANRTRLKERGRALPGARTALETVRVLPRVLQSVLTGNVEGNAFVKLDAFGLADPIDFSMGAFGHESENRADLVSVAQRKAAQRSAFRPDADAAVLVGDTVRDVEAGVEGGAQVIGVATGGVSVTDLMKAGAVTAVEDLTDLTALLDGLAVARARGAVSPQAP